MSPPPRPELQRSGRVDSLDPDDVAASAQVRHRPDGSGAVGPSPPEKRAGQHYPPGAEPDDRTVRQALADVSRSLRASRFRALVMGGISSATLARPRRTDDIDLFVHVDDVEDLVDHLAREGYDVERTDPRWLYKAYRRGVLIDLIFRSVGDIYLDADMLDHARVQLYKGVEIRTVSPEDLLVIKALASSEHRSHHWHDALGVIARCDLDWAYLTERARRFGPRRVLSLLLYAESNDLAVPADVIECLFATVHPNRAVERVDRDAFGGTVGPVAPAGPVAPGGRLTPVGLRAAATGGRGHDG